MFAVRSATRANLPRTYAFSLVNDPPPNTPTASRPDASVNALERLCDTIECNIPGRFDEATVGRPDERRRQPVGMSEWRTRRPAFHAEAAFVDRKPGVADELDACRVPPTCIPH